MGCVQTRHALKEDLVLIVREKKLGLYKYKISEIKEVFLNLLSI